MKQGELEDDDTPDVTGYRGKVKSRYYDKDALLAFVDLLGTKRLYENTPSQDQVARIFNSLLREFDIAFSGSNRFRAREIRDNFDVRVFADSIVISPRKTTANVVERLVELLLDYQDGLLRNCHPAQMSRAILTMGSFFSLKLVDPSDASIFGSQYATVSLCGGESVTFAHNCLEGLPMGVYVTDRVAGGLTMEQRTRVIPVKPPEEHVSLFFVKRRTGVDEFIPPCTCALLDEKSKTRQKAVVNSMKVALKDDDFGSTLQLWHRIGRTAFESQEARDKWMPWVFVHLGMSDEIVRASGSAKRPLRPGTRRGQVCISASIHENREGTRALRNSTSPGGI